MAVYLGALRRAALVGSLISLTASCADAPPVGEAQGSVTSKLLVAKAATELPASPPSDGDPIDIDNWGGYVAGSPSDALFAMHLSGRKGKTDVAGLTVAFVEGSARSQGDLADRVAKASRLEVRFNDGSNLVSAHGFGTNRTEASHRGHPESEALLQRAFNDAESLLRLPMDQAGGGEKAAACMASFLATVSAAARCVDDATNTDDCNAVRTEGVLVVAACTHAETGTASSAQESQDVLLGHGSVHTQALSGLGGLFSTVFPLLANAGGFGSFASLLGGAGGTSGLGGFANLLGGLFSRFVGGGASTGGTGSALPNLFNGLAGGQLTNIAGLLQGSSSPFATFGNAFGGTSFASALFGNRSISVNSRTGGVTGIPLLGGF